MATAMAKNGFNGVKWECSHWGGCFLPLMPPQCEHLRRKSKVAIAIAVTQCERAFIHVSYRKDPAHIKELVWHPPP